MDEFYTGPIPDELWKPIQDHPDYWISNYGRVFSFKSDKFLKPLKVKHQLHYSIEGLGSKSVRAILFNHYPRRLIKYDYGIPPRKVLIERIKRGKIGVYPNGKYWRVLIQASGIQHCRTFESKDEARNNWLFMYCRVHGLSYEQTFEQVKETGYQRIDLRK